MTHLFQWRGFIWTTRRVPRNTTLTTLETNCSKNCVIKVSIRVFTDAHQASDMETRKVRIGHFKGKNLDKEVSKRQNSISDSAHATEGRVLKDCCDEKKVPHLHPSSHESTSKNPDKARKLLTASWRYKGNLTRRIQLVIFTQSTKVLLLSHLLCNI